MSGPLEELRDWLASIRLASSGEIVLAIQPFGTVAPFTIRLDDLAALLAASGTGERPAGLAAATAVAWLHSDPGRCNHVETGDMGCVPSCSNPQGEWIPLVPATPRPTPPDAGTGTPSDDGPSNEALAEAIERDADWFDGGGCTATAITYRLIATRLRTTPAAPSGTTGATTGDES